MTQTFGTTPTSTSARRQRPRRAAQRTTPPATGRSRTQRNPAITAAFIERTTRQFLPLLQRWVGNWHDAVDVLQEAYAHVLDFPSFDPGSERADGFLLNKLRWLTQDVWRTRALRRTVNLSALAQDEEELELNDKTSLPPERGLLREEALDKLRQAIAGLDSNYRRVISLHLAGLDRHAIAARLALPLTTVDMRLYHARRLLHRALGHNPLTEASC